MHSEDVDAFRVHMNAFRVHLNAFTRCGCIQSSPKDVDVNEDVDEMDEDVDEMDAFRVHLKMWMHSEFT